MVIYWTTMVVTGNGELGFDSGEGALETATTSKEGSRRETYPLLKRKSEVRRRLDTALVLTVNDAISRFGGFMPYRGATRKRKSFGSGGSMVAKLKLKEIDGRAPQGVELAA
uniref:Uncharacterized protein n=3 Tax=Caenorhabditis japonica TaxID=281687 RepID=A0A8R1E3S7_CAEJA